MNDEMILVYDSRSAELNAYASDHQRFRVRRRSFLRSAAVVDHVDVTFSEPVRANTLGGALNVIWTVNHSGTPLSGYWLDAVYLAADSILDSTDRKLAVVTGPSPTPSANSATLTLPLDGALASGDY